MLLFDDVNREIMWQDQMRMMSPRPGHDASLLHSGVSQLDVDTIHSTAVITLIH